MFPVLSGLVWFGSLQVSSGSTRTLGVSRCWFGPIFTERRLVARENGADESTDAGGGPVGAPESRDQGRRFLVMSPVGSSTAVVT